MRVCSANKKQKILVVGNQPAVLISLRTMLSVRALHVIATDEPRVAIRLAQSMHAEIGLALIDVCTLAMKPRELADELRAQGAFLFEPGGWRSYPPGRCRSGRRRAAQRRRGEGD